MAKVFILHNKAWLRFSSGNSAEGKLFEEHCSTLGLTQLVREPTRENYLLDLVLTDLEDVSCRVAPGVSDHERVECKLKLVVPAETTVQRTVWDFHKAEWELLRQLLRNTSWTFVSEEDPDTAAEKLNDILLEYLGRSVPQRQVQEKKRTHPWLNDRVLRLVKAKQAAAGTEQERAAAQACSKAILEEYHSYVDRVRAELSQLPRGSKRWWVKTQELLQQRCKNCSVPALRKVDKTWVTSSVDKACLLAETFAAKFSLHPEQANEYTLLPACSSVPDWDLPTKEKAEQLLKKLDEGSATGPDLLPTRLLHHCATELAEPLHRLAEAVLKKGRWPELWLQHWIIPLYKRKAVWNAANYRGIHLTAQLAKCTERFFLTAFGTFLASPQVSGENQFAYKQERGARDVLAYLVLTWIDGFNSRKKFALYNADVSGAFDRVSTERLLQKLANLGVAERWLQLFRSWLRQRPARVVVGGSKSAELALKDMLFQGTVWGPQLWNTFFNDVRRPILREGFTEIVYADDCNAFKAFDEKVPNSIVLKEAETCQKEVHRWGDANQVAFDPTKESLHVLSCRKTDSADFVTLGVDFDCGLTMVNAIRAISTEAQRRIKVLLRSSRYQCDAQLLLLYKSRVLSYLEYRTPAVYHASDKAMQKLEAVQERLDACA